MPEVTVLMSVYNGEKYLKKAIESILCQTFTDFEFLIVNDGSTDATSDIVLSYADARIHFVRNEKNIGLARALNKGIKLAQGKSIARQDADDVSLPTRLEKEVLFLDQHKDVYLLGSAFQVINKKGEMLTTVPVLTGNSEIQPALLQANQFCHGTIMFRKSIATSVGLYRPEFATAQDYDFWLRISERYAVANISEPLYQWRLTTNSISGARRIQQGYYDFLARELARERRHLGQDRLQKSSHHPDEQIHTEFRPYFRLDKTRVIQDYVHWGYLLRRNKDYAEAFGFLKQGLLLSPFHLKVWEQLGKLFLCRLLPERLLHALTHQVMT